MNGIRVTTIHAVLVSSVLSLPTDLLRANDTESGLISTETQCLADLAGQEALMCSGSDLSFTIKEAAILDSCDYIGDTAIIVPAVDLSSLANRFDIASFIALDGGDAMSGICQASVFPETTPFIDAEPEQAEDTCGDLQGGTPVSGFELPAITIPCRDEDSNGLVDISICTAWSNNGSNICQGPADLTYFSSRCSCSMVNLGNLPVPSVTIEVRKQLNPPSDKGLFDLQISGQSWVLGVGDGGTTGPIEVFLGDSMIVGELATHPTSLAEYHSSIECFDRVGRCSLDENVHCTVDHECMTQQAGICDQTPTMFANCTECTSLNVAASPTGFGTAQCTITNTLKNAPGQITLVKETIPGGDSAAFMFTADYSGNEISLSDGQQHSSGDLVPGIYSVSEIPLVGWTPEGASCSDGSLPSAIVLDAGEETVCTFVNRKEDVYEDGFETGNNE